MLGRGGGGMETFLMPRVSPSARAHLPWASRFVKPPPSASVRRRDRREERRCYLRGNREAADNEQEELRRRRRRRRRQRLVIYRRKSVGRKEGRKEGRKRTKSLRGRGSGRMTSGMNCQFLVKWIFFLVHSSSMNNEKRRTLLQA